MTSGCRPQNFQWISDSRPSVDFSSKFRFSVSIVSVMKLPYKVSFSPFTSLKASILPHWRISSNLTIGVCFRHIWLNGKPLKNDMIDERFGIGKLQGEQQIFAAEPTGFIRHCLAVMACSVVGILFLPVVWIYATVAKDKYRYWLTNRRIILSSGFIGFQVRSIPLERISDVSLSKTLPEILAGVSSLVVRDMTGEADQGQSLLAITDSSEYQRQILNEIRKVNSKLAVV